MCREVNFSVLPATRMCRVASVDRALEGFSPGSIHWLKLGRQTKKLSSNTNQLNRYLLISSLYVGITYHVNMFQEIIVWVFKSLRILRVVYALGI